MIPFWLHRKRQDFTGRRKCRQNESRYWIIPLGRLFALFSRGVHVIRSPLKVAQADTGRLEGEHIPGEGTAEVVRRDNALIHSE